MKNLVPDFQSSIKRHRRDQQKNKPELLQKRYLYTGWITGEIYPEIGNKKIRVSRVVYLLFTTRQPAIMSCSACFFAVKATIR